MTGPCARIRATFQPIWSIKCLPNDGKAPIRLLRTGVGKAQELEATTVLSLPIEEASAKIRTGPPIDLDADYARPCWAGVLPLELTAGTPVPDARVPPGLEPPPAISSWSRKPRAR